MFNGLLDRFKVKVIDEDVSKLEARHIVIFQACHELFEFLGVSHELFYYLSASIRSD
jgi:hypothetical protein